MAVTMSLKVYQDNVVVLIIMVIHGINAVSYMNAWIYKYIYIYVYIHRVAIDVCTNSYSTKYQGTYSQRYECADGIVNNTIYWGHDCLGEPVIQATVLEWNTTFCWNTTNPDSDSGGGWYWSSYDWNNTYYYDWNSTYYHDWNSSYYYDSNSSSYHGNYDTYTANNYTIDDIVYYERCTWYTYEGWLNFNCDETLPLCTYANFTYLDPLEGERDCVNDKSKSNWETSSEPVNICSCWTVPDYDWYIGDDGWWDYQITNITDCVMNVCNEEGIYEVYIEDVNTSLPQEQWCDEIDPDTLNTSDWWNVYTLYEVGCDRDIGQWLEIAYCPSLDDHSNILKSTISISLSLIILNYVL